jgi:hypothetical protein
MPNLHALYRAGQRIIRPEPVFGEQPAPHDAAGVAHFDGKLMAVMDGVLCNALRRTL